MRDPATLQRPATPWRTLPGPGSTDREIIHTLYALVVELCAEVAELRADLGIQPTTWLSPSDAGRLLGKPASSVKSACRAAYRDMAAPDFTLWVAIAAGGRVRKVKGTPIPDGVGYSVGTVLAKLDDSSSDPRKRTRQSYLIRRRDIVNLRRAVI